MKAWRTAPIRPFAALPRWSRNGRVAPGATVPERSFERVTSTRRAALVPSNRASRIDVDREFASALPIGSIRPFADGWDHTVVGCLVPNKKGRRTASRRSLLFSAALLRHGALDLQHGLKRQPRGGLGRPNAQ